VAVCCEHRNETLGSIKYGALLDYSRASDSVRWFTRHSTTWNGS